VEIYDISFGLPSLKRGKSGLSLSQGREERKRRKEDKMERSGIGVSAILTPQGLKSVREDYS